MSELFPGSSESWAATPKDSRLAPELVGYREQPWRERARGFRERTRLRRANAEAIHARMSNPENGLPVADNATVMRFFRTEIGKRKWLATAMVVLNVLAAAAGLMVPRLLGGLIDDVTTITDGIADILLKTSLTVLGFVVAQTLLSFLARRTSTVFGQDLLASARERIIRSVLRLPLSRVESASTGDLVTRVTRDVSMMAGAVRWALPNFILASITVLFTFVAMILNSFILTVPLLIGSFFFVMAAARYNRLAPKGYLAEGDAYSTVNSTLTETVEGARTVEALNLQSRRVRATEDDLEVAGQAERYTMTLRAELYLVTDFAVRLPLVAVLLLGGLGYAQGWATIGEITAATLYLQQITHPLAMMVQTLNMLQEGVASTSRLLGISVVKPDRTESGLEPADDHLIGRDLRFAYRPGRDVLHGVDLDLIPGERLAIVGPSGSGKSTLGRLLAGINGPRTGEVTVGGVNIMGLPLQKLRTEVALVTQEHHVFVGSIRDNVVLAREETATDDEVWDALRTVEADDWVRRLPDGLATRVGSGNMALTPAQAQQIALARLVIADPNTLVLDEATSLIDPHTARHVEGSMSALLTDRTVVAIAHRLHTAHDADRIAVVIDGKIAELGSHHELMALDGEYAALWNAWTS